MKRPLCQMEDRSKDEGVLQNRNEKGEWSRNESVLVDELPTLSIGGRGCKQDYSCTAQPSKDLQSHSSDLQPLSNGRHLLLNRDLAADT